MFKVGDYAIYKENQDDMIAPFFGVTANKKYRIIHVDDYTGNGMILLHLIDDDGHSRRMSSNRFNKSEDE